MNHSIRLRDEAERDITLAASWYEEQREGLGQEFLDESWQHLERSQSSPARTQYSIAACVAP